MKIKTTVKIKVKAIVVKLDSPTGKVEDYIYSNTGFLREIQLIDKEGKILHKSGAFHPQGAISFTVGNRQFYWPGHGKLVYHAKLE